MKLNKNNKQNQVRVLQLPPTLSKNRHVGGIGNSKIVCRFARGCEWLFDYMTPAEPVAHLRNRSVVNMDGWMENEIKTKQYKQN